MVLIGIVYMSVCIGPSTEPWSPPQVRGYGRTWSQKHLQKNSKTIDELNHQEQCQICQTRIKDDEGG